MFLIRAPIHGTFAKRWTLHHWHTYGQGSEGWKPVELMGTWAPRGSSYRHSFSDSEAAACVPKEIRFCLEFCTRRSKSVENFDFCSTTFCHALSLRCYGGICSSIQTLQSTDNCVRNNKRPLFLHQCARYTTHGYMHVKCMKAETGCMQIVQVHKGLYLSGFCMGNI